MSLSINTCYPFKVLNISLIHINWLLLLLMKKSTSFASLRASPSFTVGIGRVELVLGKELEVTVPLILAPNPV